MNIPRLFWAAAAFAAFSLFAWRVQQGLWAPEFGDESEHFVGAQMLQAGGVLYRTYVDAHGPVVFMLAQLYGILFGWAHPNWARLIPALLAASAGLCLAASPSLAGTSARLAAATLFFGLTAAVWLMQALYMVDYYAPAGWFLLIGLGLFIVPAWKGARISGPAAFASGAFCSLAALSAYSVIPSASILALSGIWAAIRNGRSRQAATFIAGSVIVGLGILTWLVIFGDLLGYLAFHIAANQFVYAKYINFTFGSFLRALLPRLRPDAVVHALGLLCCAWSFTVLLLKTGESDSTPRGPSCGPAHLHWLPVALGLIGVLLLNARGTMWFQDGTFLVTAIGWAAVSTPAVLLRLGSRSPAVLSCGPVLAIVAVVATVELTMRSYAVASPSGLTYRQLEQLPASELGLLDTPMFRRVRAIVSPNERVLALVYDPGFYLAAGRLPIDKYYQYLPWDADYAKAPWFGRDHDLCADLARSPPPLIYFDDWKVWNTFAPEDYMPCVLDILARTYDRSAEFPKLYIRKDRVRTTR